MQFRIKEPRQGLKVYHGINFAFFTSGERNSMPTRKPGGMDHEMEGKTRLKRTAALISLVILIGGLISYLAH